MPGRARANASTIGAIYDRISPAVEDAMIATCKTLSRSVPTPRRDPWYGLDRLGGPDLCLLERVTTHGDFRKYVFVLDAGSGLGGIARWLTLTYGCRVLVLDTFLRLLTERSAGEAMAWRRHKQEDESVRTTVRGPDYAVARFFARRPSV